MTKPDLREDLQARWHRLRQRVDQACLAVGREPAEVTVLPVSKTFAVEHIQAGQQLGWTRFGENRVQEVRAKQAALAADAPAWVLIGHLQSNKAKDAAAVITELQSLDRLQLAVQLHQQLERLDRTLDVLVQVHTAAEEHKHGLVAEQLPALLQGLQALPRLQLRGLMTVATQTDDQAEIRRCFAQLRQCRDQARQQLGIALPRLSMGMSGDFAVAIAEGSTELRVGSALFGGRSGVVEPMPAV